MTPFKRGDIVLVAFPFTDLTSSKMRPALVISSDAFNDKSPDLIVAAVTSKIHTKLTGSEFKLSAVDQNDAHLPKPSIIKLGKIVTLDKRLIRKKLGQLNKITLNKISSILHNILS